MSQSEKVILEKVDDKVIGICGYAKWNSRKHLFRKSFYKKFKNILINSHLIENKDGMIEYLDNYDYMSSELENYFDGEISIIIVDDKFRNQGIGKRMIFKIFECAKNDGMSNLQILSDESCNYKFYEKIGCKKIFEKEIINCESNKCGKSISEFGYIYEKKLD